MSQFSQGYPAMTELRVGLVGNVDFKVKLANDTVILKLLLDNFSSNVSQLISGDSASQSELENQYAVLKLLVHSVSGFDTYSSLIHDFATPILGLLNNYTTNQHSSLCPLISVCLDILLALSRLQKVEIPMNRFLIVLIKTSSDQILLKLLKLVLALSEEPDMESVLLAELNSICENILDFHVPCQTPAILEKLAFDLCLPNIELLPSFNQYNLNPDILLHFIVACCHQLSEKAKVLKYQKNESSGDYAPSSYFGEDKLTIKSYIVLLVLIKSYDIDVSVSALNFICFYLETEHASNKFLIENYKKLMPRIVDLLDLRFESSKPKILTINISSPLKIAANYCLQYPIFTEEFKRANIDLSLVKKLQIDYNECELFSVLQGMRSDDCAGKVANFCALESLANYKEQLKTLGDNLLLLSVYTSSSEIHRQRIINENSETSILPVVVFRIIESYLFLMIQLHLIYKLVANHQQKKKLLNPKTLNWLSKNLGVLVNLLDDDVFTNCLLLSRSLSRSISASRTFFVECNSLRTFTIRNGSKNTAGGFITNLIESLAYFNTTKQCLDFFYESTKSTNDDSVQIQNLSIILGIVSNLIREGSSFTYNIVNYSNFYSCLTKIYGGYSQYDVTSFNEMHVQLVKLNVLQVLRSFMGIETNENKMEVLDHFGWHSIFSKASFGVFHSDFSPESKRLRIQQKLVAIDILRNCTAGSEELCKNLVEFYQNEFVRVHVGLPRSWPEFVIMNIENGDLFENGVKYPFKDPTAMIRLLSNEDYVKMVTSLNYIDNHRFTKINIDSDKFPPDSLLKLWLKFLTFELSENLLKEFNTNQEALITNNLNEIKLSIVWIIINLTMVSSSFGLTMSSQNNFSMFDTIQSQPFFEPPNISRRVSNGIGEDQLSENSNDMSVQKRAKVLQNHGFLNAITSLINKFNEEGDVNGEHNPVAKCFTIQNSYDLLERLKNARDQILWLLDANFKRSGKFPVSNEGSDEGNRQVSSDHRQINSRRSSEGNRRSSEGNREDLRSADSGNEDGDQRHESGDNEDYDGDAIMDDIVEELEDSRDIWI